MKLSLTITDASASEMARIIAAAAGTAAVATVATGTPPANVPAPSPSTNSDDDESGDQEAAPGSVDKDGLPWDDRIHSTPAKMTGKGVWRKKRGVSDDTIRQVEAELRSRVSQPAPAAPAATPPMPQPEAAPAADNPPPPGMPTFIQGNQPADPAPAPQQPAPPPLPDQNGYPAPAAPVQPAAPATPPMPQPAPTPAPAAPAPQETGQMDFNAFMQKIAGLLQQRFNDGSPVLDANYLSTVAQRTGQAFNVQCNAITDLAGNQAMIDYAIQIMKNEQRWF